MADGKRRDAWKHTSALLAMHYNRTLAKGQPLPPSAFDPFEEPAKHGRVTAGNIETLKDLVPFGKKKHKKK